MKLNPVQQNALWDKCNELAESAPWVFIIVDGRGYRHAAVLSNIPRKVLPVALKAFRRITKQP